MAYDAMVYDAMGYDGIDYDVMAFEAMAPFPEKPWPIYADPEAGCIYHPRHFVCACAVTQLASRVMCPLDLWSVGAFVEHREGRLDVLKSLMVCMLFSLKGLQILFVPPPNNNNKTVRLKG